MEKVYAIPRAGSAYLTVGKMYLVIGSGNDATFSIVDDDGDTIACSWVSCGHIRGAGFDRVEGDNILPMTRVTKVYAVPTEGGDSLTEGEKYLVLRDFGDGSFLIKDDYGDELVCSWEDCENIFYNDYDRMEEVSFVPGAHPQRQPLTSKVPFTQKRKIPLP